MRLQLIGVAVITGLGVIAVVQHQFRSVDPGLVGLSLSYALSITLLLSGLISSFTQTEMQLVSVERTQEYCTELPTEPQQHNAEVRLWCCIFIVNKLSSRTWTRQWQGHVEVVTGSRSKVMHDPWKETFKVESQNNVIVLLSVASCIFQKSRKELVVVVSGKSIVSKLFSSFFCFSTVLVARLVARAGLSGVQGSGAVLQRGAS